MNMVNGNMFGQTYCNPIPLPDYPIGRLCYDEDTKRLMDYRETADPSVIFEDGVWYLYPSCGMVYWSEDYIHWNHKKMEPYDLGYAPTVVKHKGRFLLTACDAGLYESDSPLGPFKEMGNFKNVDGGSIFFGDPMLFSDDDGRLYLYSGVGGNIRGTELDADNPLQLLIENDIRIEMDTEKHTWERVGDWNEDPHYSFIEGAWMYKRNGIYYLTYAAPGTEYISYGMGAYKSRSPLGPWEYMKTSPFLLTKHGMVRGTGHGCLVDGPNGTTWVFYTCNQCYAHPFERRTGYDLIGFDENGDIIPVSASENPQWGPGLIEMVGPGENGAGLIPVTQRKPCNASSFAPGRDGLYAIDDSTLTWWQPDASDPTPMLTVKLSGYGPLEIAAVRIWWRDVGLDLKKGVLPGPFGYKVEARMEDGDWFCVVDKSDNIIDMTIDYIPFEVREAMEVRLIITSKPCGIEPGVINFTVFGIIPFGK